MMNLQFVSYWPRFIPSEILPSKNLQNLEQLAEVAFSKRDASARATLQGLIDQKDEIGIAAIKNVLERHPKYIMLCCGPGGDELIKSISQKLDLHKIAKKIEKDLDAIRALSCLAKKAERPEAIELLKHYPVNQNTSIRVLYLLYQEGKNVRALEMLKLLAEEKTFALEALLRIAKNENIYVQVPSRTGIKIHELRPSPHSEELYKFINDSKFTKTKINLLWESRTLQWQSGFMLGGGGNRDRQGGFRAAIFPVEARFSTDPVLKPYPKMSVLYLTIAAEVRLGSGPVGRFAGGGRLGLGYGFVGLNFRGGVHEGGRPYLGGEVDLPGAFFRPSRCLDFDCIPYFLPSLILGYERVLGADVFTKRAEEMIYAGLQWVIPWASRNFSYRRLD